MGILDNKLRVMDTVITQEGRRQMSTGRMKIEYYSFTDRDVFYQSASLGSKVTDDATSRFYFEAQPSLPEDQITFEANDSGLLNIFGRDAEINVINGQIIKKNVAIDSLIVSGSTTYNILSGAAFASTFEGLLTSSIENFKNLQVISNKNVFSDEFFELSQNSLQINFKRNALIPSQNQLQSLDKLPDFLSDPKFSNSINFKFLPPIKKIPKGSKVSSYTTSELTTNFGLGVYIPQSPVDSITYSDIQNGFLSTINAGNYNGLKKSKDVIGTLQEILLETPIQSTKIASQFFEISKDSKLKKLDVLDLGDLPTENPDRPKAKIIFVGKVFKDSLGRDTFLHIFTFVFD